MFGPGDERTKIVDWQFTAQGSVFLDFGTMAWISMDPKETEEQAEVRRGESALY